MLKKIKLFLLFIILSLAVISCYPLNENRYGDQGNRDHRERHQRHQQDSRDHGDRDNGDRDQYSPQY